LALSTLFSLFDQCMGSNQPIVLQTFREVIIDPNLVQLPLIRLELDFYVSVLNQFITNSTPPHVIL
jgi:hypothetical protein